MHSLHRNADATVVFAGGGTGGHLYPALAIADSLRGLRPDVVPLFVGAERGIEAKVLPDRGECYLLVDVRSLDRTRPWRAIGTLWALVQAVAAVIAAFRRVRPWTVVATGGYAAAPAGLAAILLGIPLVVQGQNAYPGLVIRWLSRWANSVHIAFPEASRHLPRRVRQRVLLSGNPVRAVNGNTRDLMRKELGIASSSFLVVISGGSQGAAPLNHAVLDWARLASAQEVPMPDRLVALWSFGQGHVTEIEGALKGFDTPWLVAVPYIDDLPSAFAAADLAVGRAGAMTTAEMLNAGLPSILIPLPGAAADHQAINARALADAGAATVMDEANLTATSLATAIATLANDRARLAEMGRHARARARPDAAHRIASDIVHRIPPPTRIRSSSPKSRKDQ